MTSYWDERFSRHLKDKDVKFICEVGARYGDESIKLASIFKNATILSFECNPNTVEICREKLKNNHSIRFFDFGLGIDNDKLPFYSFNRDNDGASSFYKRVDFESTQRLAGYINIRPLYDVLTEENIPHIDLLCMDVQGFELNVLKGCKGYLTKIKYIILEEPKPVINRNYLPENTHSKYVNAPSSQEIKDFMTANNFVEVERLSENAIEDNVMYANMSTFDKQQ
jgi:FkbM family methyltransferase